ncbi:MAG: MBL fold metallo-hydrolase, partial [Alphaproteobacteria bacterium]
MTDLFALSRAVIDEGKGTDQVGPINRINHQLSELRPDIAVVEAFSHSIVFRTDDGLVAFDTSNPRGGSKVVSEIRRWSGDRFNTIVYTHGHVDHVGGCGAFVADAASHGHPGICICGHENVAERFDRYRMTNGYNQVINERQFGQFRRRGYGMTEADKPVTPFLP